MKVLATSILSLVFVLPLSMGCSAPEEPAADAQPAAEADAAADEGSATKPAGSDSK